MQSQAGVKLYVDDERYPKTDNWIIVRSFTEAKEFIVTKGCPSYISFDHDLGLDGTGLDLAKWLVEEDLDNNIIPDDFDFNVHSANPVGAENIRSLINSYLTFKGLK